MKKHFLITLLTLFAVNLYSADSLKVHKNRVYLGVFFANTHSKIFIPEIYDPYYYYGPKPYIEREGFSFRAGIDIKIKLFKRLFLVTGILLNSKADQTIYPYATYSPYTLYERYTRRTTNLQVPLRLDLRLTGKRFAPFITVGGNFSGELARRNNSYLEYVNGQKKRYHGTLSFKDTSKKIQPYCQVGAGLDVNIKRLKLQVMPLYEFTFYKNYVTVTPFGTAVITPKAFSHTISGVVSVSCSL